MAGVSRPLGYQYDLEGNRNPDACQVGAQGIEGPDRITRFSYDGYDQVLTQERAVGTSIAQTYVTNVYYGRGALQSQTDANGNKTELRYDGNWRLQRRVYPSKFTPGILNESDFNEYTYDKNGNVVLEHKRNGATIASTYDTNNRLIFKDLSDNTYSGDISYGYDLRGLTRYACFGTASTSSCDSSGEGETNLFDEMGNLTSRTSRMAGTSRTLAYQYDLEGDRKRVTHPDAWFFEYGFDGLNRMNSLAESASASPAAGTSTLLTINYRATGGRESIIRTGGATTSIEPNNALRLKKFTQDFVLTNNDLTNEFGYNHASQVISLSQSNTQYNYTEAQNRVGAYTPNGLNQYTSIDGGPTIAYDGNGNLTSDGEGRSYTYDMENHLVATGGSASSTLVYDVLGRLAQISVNGTTTQFHYDGDALVGEYVSGSLTRRYVHGDQVDEPLVLYSNGVVSPSTRRYLHADHQGSVIAQSDNAGAAVQKNAYDPYGSAATTNDGRFGYTGQTWLKELGLNYYKARIYSPKLGRFLQTDPIFYADDMNVYAYVGNDPLNRADPTGTDGEPSGTPQKCQDGPCNNLPPGGADETGKEGVVVQPPNSPYEQDGVTLKPPTPAKTTPEQDKIERALISAQSQNVNEQKAQEEAAAGNEDEANRFLEEANKDLRQYYEKQSGKLPSAKEMPPSAIPKPLIPREVVPLPPGMGPVAPSPLPL